MPSPYESTDRRAERKNETRQAIRAAANRLFAERGFAATTIDDITTAADVARRTFFRYYGSKADLLRADVADALPTLLTELRHRPADEPPLLSILAALRTVLGSAGIAGDLAGPVANLRALAGLVRLLTQWERGITDTLLARWDVDRTSATEAQQLRASVTACAATSALRASVQSYRARYGGPLDPRLLLPIVEQAFATLNEGCA